MGTSAWAALAGMSMFGMWVTAVVGALLGMLLVVGVAAYEGHLHPPYGALLTSGLLRWALVLDMLIGTVLLWRLVPRIDARRIRPGSACMAVAAIMAISFGVATSLA
jgi:uncharacterized BrkB/YihY/UPF0761 family membrane protein